MRNAIVILSSYNDWTNEEIHYSKSDVGLLIRCGYISRTSPPSYHQPFPGFLCLLSPRQLRSPHSSPLVFPKFTRFSILQHFVGWKYTTDDITQCHTFDSGYSQTIWPAPHPRPYQQRGLNCRIIITPLGIHCSLQLSSPFDWTNQLLPQTDRL